MIVLERDIYVHTHYFFLEYFLDTLIHLIRAFAITKRHQLSTLEEIQGNRSIRLHVYVKQ
ncbi:hypothetical protein Hanom_Chr09g00778791 [Helianthus anomalus]